MKKYLLLIFISTFLFSCKKDAGDLQIKYGTSFGECMGYCNKELTLKENAAVLTLTKNGPDPETRSCSRTISDSELARLKKAFTTEVFFKMEDTYGCPDCADGGAEWIEITRGSKVKRVVFEYGKAPGEIEKLTVWLREIKGSFKDCTP